jgi:hypothetical protein
LERRPCYICADDHKGINCHHFRTRNQLECAYCRKKGHLIKACLRKPKNGLPLAGRVQRK